ncbi:hypothetical protein BC936DRAFT_137094 [Jimgerdemannia flammicorona]|uniref:Uncharacterized protein n=2 Tax=Jimgerdemannia flammicorona TaxID=994334 RepID=A0A433PAI1_9FUNG|nr:hypothetical protein BC936DRAFT_137094 [Jimgerdemannia flammicorona]RUS14522.1 hypothetical protein BC938DRAFT_477319 [Jimgerdemannia flammicorona]
MLLVKKLITYDPEDRVQVSDFPLSTLPEAGPDTSCLDILNFFQEGRSHMALITNNPGGEGAVLGVITLEDVIEELIGEEIIDETDVYIDVHNKIKVIRRPPHRHTAIHPRLYPLLNARWNPSTVGSPTPSNGMPSRRTSSTNMPSSPVLRSSHHAEMGITPQIMGYGAIMGDERGRASTTHGADGNESKPLL